VCPHGEICLVHCCLEYKVLNCATNVAYFFGLTTFFSSILLPL
jgi:hypothetical protein